MYNYFDFQDYVFLVTGLLLLIASVVFFHMGKKYTPLILLILGAISIGSFIALINQYLWTWDEQFHAVVAKNMMREPFCPMFYTDPIYPYDFKNWGANHIWLHKQPLFLWQMALSMKVFGVGVWGLRFPSVLMHALMCIFIFRIGKNVLNEKVGFYGALLFAIANYPLEMVSGIHASDHNDVAFLFYLTASFWAWFEYWKSGQRKWLIIVGITAGSAVLVKWLTGLLVYFLWTTVLVLNKEKRKQSRNYIDVFVSFALALVVFLPWQVYIFTVFPQEAWYEYTMNAKHLTSCIEGHCGDVWFYFENLSTL